MYSVQYFQNGIGKSIINLIFKDRFSQIISDAYTYYKPNKLILDMKLASKIFSNS
jgi:hypothetical protein